MVCEYNVIEKLMQDKGVIPAEVCKETGLDPASFTSWKKGVYKPKVDKLIRLARYFDVPLENFVVEETTDD